MLLDRIIYIPICPEPKYSKKGYGGKSGCPSGHRLKSIGGTGLLYGSGCSKWNDCFTCPDDDCTFEYGREHKKSRENAK